MAEKECISELTEVLHAADLLGDEDRISRLNFFRWHKGCGPDGRFLTKCRFMLFPAPRVSRWLSSLALFIDKRYNS